MAKNVFNNNKPTAQVSMNAFDNGQFQTYSTKAGIGLPCFYLHTTPKMKARINVQNYLMAENLRQNAFLRCKQNIDFFFVPYRQLNHQFSPLYYGRDDKQHAFQLGSTPSVPYFNISKIFYFLANAYSLCRAITYLRKSHFNYIKNKVSDGSLNYDLLPFESFDSYLITLSDGIYNYNNDTNINNSKVRVKNFLDDNIKDVYYLLDRHYFDDGHDLTNWNNLLELQIFQTFCVAQDFNVEDCLRTLDMLGYGNFYPVLKHNYDVNIVSELYNDGSPDLETYLAKLWSNDFDSSTPYYNERSIANNFCAALNAITRIQQEQPARSLNAFALMAYQKIFDNVYRNNVVVPRFKFGHDLVYSFNNDGLSPDLLSTFSPGAFCGMFLHPWYIQHRRNLSNGLWNSAQFGQVSYAVTTQDMQNNDPVSIPDLRYAFAMQTFKERLLRCGDKEKDLLKGLFGVKSRYVGDEYIYYIGSYDGVFNVNTVQDVSGENLGRLGGNIISSIQGNQLEFHCEDFGVIIGIHSILPTMLYSAFGIDLQNTKYYQFDFYHPDFENLGLQPVQKWQFISPYFGSMFNTNSILGYGARFIEYKQKLDLSHGTFSDLPFYNNDSPIADTFSTDRGIDSDYVTNFDLSSVGSYEAQYVRPDSLDNIFDTLTDYSIESDHFKTWLNVQCDTLLPMSVLGLPQLN